MWVILGHSAKKNGQPVPGLECRTLSWYAQLLTTRPPPPSWMFFLMKHFSGKYFRYIFLSHTWGRKKTNIKSSILSLLSYYLTVVAPISWLSNRSVNQSINLYFSFFCSWLWRDSSHISLFVSSTADSHNKHFSRDLA